MAEFSVTLVGSSTIVTAGTFNTKTAAYENVGLMVSHRNHSLYLQLESIPYFLSHIWTKKIQSYQIAQVSG